MEMGLWPSVWLNDGQSRMRRTPYRRSINESVVTRAEWGSDAPIAAAVVPLVKISTPVVSGAARGPKATGTGNSNPTSASNANEVAVYLTHSGTLPVARRSAGNRYTHSAKATIRKSMLGRSIRLILV